MSRLYVVNKYIKTGFGAYLQNNRIHSYRKTQGIIKARLLTSLFIHIVFPLCPILSSFQSRSIMSSINPTDEAPRLLFASRPLFPFLQARFPFLLASRHICMQAPRLMHRVKPSCTFKHKKIPPLAPMTLPSQPTMKILTQRGPIRPQK